MNFATVVCLCGFFLFFFFFFFFFIVCVFFFFFFFFSSRRRHTRSLCDWSSDVCSSDLFGVSPTDAATLSAVIFLVLAVAGAASLVPAIRAAHVEPMQVLHEE